MPSGMELFPAANEDQWTLIKKVIDDCDYYVVIIGGRYGSLGSEGKSYTQMEYEYAISKKKPTIAFLHQNPSAIPAGKTEKTDDGKQKLEQFRKLAETKMVKYWKTPQDLGSVVSRSIVKLIKANPAVGWVRSDELVEGAAAQELLRLRKQIDELQVRLQQSSSQAPQGTEELSSGDERYTVSFDTEFKDKVYKGYTWQISIRLGWNTIFKVLSPLMIDKATSAELARALREHVSQKIVEKIQKDTPGASSIVIKIVPNALRTIIVQLRALGLIAKDERQRSVRDTETYWTLTPYGDNVMTRLNAITKTESSGRSD